MKSFESRSVSSLSPVAEQMPRFRALQGGRVLAVALLGMAGWIGQAHADGLSTLDAYIRHTHAGAASFTQSVSTVGKSGAARQSSGTFAFQRPNRFRFDYRKPYVQTIVADGRHLWMYDAELRQVTQRSQSKVLDATPAALVASATSLDALKARFTLENATGSGSLTWVKATPKGKEGQVKEVMIGFEGNDLRRLVILDGFGQRSDLTFGKFSSTVPAGMKFSFVPPKGADVLKQ